MVRFPFSTFLSGWAASSLCPTCGEILPIVWVGHGFLLANGGGGGACFTTHYQASHLSPCLHVCTQLDAGCDMATTCNFRQCVSFGSAAATGNENTVCSVIHYYFPRSRLFQPVDWSWGGTCTPASSLVQFHW